jgi:hypothetical protein
MSRYACKESTVKKKKKKKKEVSEEEENERKWGRISPAFLLMTVLFISHTGAFSSIFWLSLIVHT